MKNFELHDFIEDYDCSNNEDIQWNTASRKEFYDLASKRNKQEKVGRFFNHQEVMLRYIRQYDRIFNIQATGTGKTGGIINVSEFYKKNDEGIKRVYIIEPGPSTVEEFKKQIQKLSDPEDYINEKIKKATRQKAIKNNISRLIREWYSIETYKQFAKIDLNDEEIIETYSDCVFFFDEIHTLRNNLPDGKGSSVTQKEMEKIYNYIWKVLHLAKRTKIILASATPMINSTKDFVPLLNLILPMNYQLPTHKDNFYDSVTLAQLEPFLRGKITFVRFLESDVKIINQGEVFSDYEHHIYFPSRKNLKGPELIPAIKGLEGGKIIEYNEKELKNQEMADLSIKKIKSQRTIYCLEMGPIQLETYKKTLKNKKTFSLYSRQSLVFVFPNGQTGCDGFNTYIKTNNLKELEFKKTIIYKDKKYDGIPSMIDGRKESDIEKSFYNLGLLSSKFKFYIEKELEASRKEKPGNSFCFLEFVEGSGAELLGLLLKLFGFREFKLTTSPIDLKTKRIKNLSKGKRFALLTGHSKNIQSSLDVFNSPDNIDGEYIQIIIASGVVRDGVNIKNVLRGYIMTPGWHESGMHQALSRFIRADSHDDIIKRIDSKVEVEVYRLASTFKDEKEILYKKGINKASLDVKLYLDSEAKDIKIKRIMRFMKQTSFDAYLTYDRNVNPKDKDYSSIADYEDKFYEIWKAEGKPGNDNRKGLAMNQGPSYKDIIYNTYNIFYADQKTKKIKQELEEILREKGIISIDKFKEYLKEKDISFDSYSFYNAIEELILNKELISGKRNIINYNLNLNGNILNLKRSDIFKNIKLSNENNIYADMDYDSLIDDEKEKVEDIYSKIYNKTEKELIDYYIETQNYSLFMQLLEDSLIRLKNNDLMKINDIILKLLSNYYIITKVPIGYIEKTQKALVAENKSGQGRTRGEGSTAGLKYLDLDKVDPKFDDKTVYVHFYRKSEKTGFGITSVLEGQTKNIRILDNGTFRDSTLAENFVFSYMFNKKQEKTMEKFKKSKYYGSYILRGGENEKYVSDKKKIFFRIIDNTNPRNKGKVCKFENVDNLIKILNYIDKENKYPIKDKKPRKDEVCNKLLNILEEKNLLFVSF